MPRCWDRRVVRSAGAHGDSPSRAFAVLMGQRTSCFTRRKSQQAREGSIVPDKDPLLKTVTRRIVHDDIGRDFDLSAQVLGTGYSGAVKLAQHKETKQKVAVKQFSKRRLKPHRLKLLQSEVEVYLRLDHPNICRLLHAYESKNDVWLVMELCGCELYSRLCERKVYSEANAAEVMHQMLQAVTYLHSHRIVHRDMKLENWMYSALGPDDRLKLIDFGFSRIINGADETLDMPCGTLHYTSPEVLSRKYTSKCDIWSIGVICYMLLIGRPPFRGPNNLRIAKSILHSDFTKDGRWMALSEDARDFVSSLLRKDALMRPEAAQALTHRWILGMGSAMRCEISTDVLRNLRQFAQGSHLRRAALTVLAYSLTSRELQDLEQTFLAFDRSGQGTITLEQLAEVMEEHLEVSSDEVERIFNCLDVAEDEEVHYTPFIAAMLATRVKLHEDKVRAAFEAFDRDGTGYITAESLVQIYSASSGTLSKDEAMQWISEVDYKGNAHIDYEGFMAALAGKRLWALPQLDAGDDPLPHVRIFEEGTVNGRPRGLSESFDAVPGSFSSQIRHGLAFALIDADSESERRSQSFPEGIRDSILQIRGVSCDVHERYFA